MDTVPQAMNKISDNIRKIATSMIKYIASRTIGKRAHQIPLSRCPNKTSYSKSIEDKINGYIYTISTDSIGWNSDSYINFNFTSKLAAKSINCGCGNRGKTKTNNTRGSRNNNSKITFISDGPETLRDSSVAKMILNNRAADNHASTIPYHVALEILTNLGESIIDETDPSLSRCESSSLPTAPIRALLHDLDINLSQLSQQRVNIYRDYIEMVKLVNSVDQKYIGTVQELILNVKEGKIRDTESKLFKVYAKYLGDKYMTDFMSNELINILIQSGNHDLIIQTSHLFSILKMLFTVFGYSKLEPNVVEYVNDEEYICNESEEVKIIHKNGDISPVNQHIYQYIRMFAELYPTLIGLMGGTDNFPPEFIQITKSDIPENFMHLSSLPEFLWRYNDYSYCIYLDLIESTKHAKLAESCAGNSKLTYVKLIRKN